jgi:hypothetical protein
LRHLFHVHIVRRRTKYDAVVLGLLD